MTTPESLPDDELVSSVLDDEADDIERARVAADPALAERLDAFHDVRAQMRDITIPTELLDSLRATALDTTAAERPVTAPVFDLSARRARRTNAARWVSAAAAAVVLIAAIGLAGRDGDDSSSGDASMTAVFGEGSTGSTGSRESATAGAAGSSPDLGASTGASAAAGGDTSKKAGTGSTAAPSAPLSDLGTFVDLDALRAAYRARAADGPVPTTAPTATATTTGTTCGGVVGLAVLGTRRVALVADGTSVLVVDRVSCATVATFTP